MIVHFRKVIKLGFKFGCPLRLQLPLKKINLTTCQFELGLLRFYVLNLIFPYFFIFPVRMNSDCTVHAHGLIMQETKCTVHRTNNNFIQKKKLKMGPTALFTHSKIIFLRYFQFSDFSKISCIRTDPTYFENLTIDYMFFIFLTHMSNFVIIGYYLLYNA